MTIDVRLLRNARDAEKVAVWQSLRERDVDVEKIVRLDQEYREALQTLNAYKAQCRRERQRPDPDYLKKLQEISNRLLATFQAGLSTLGNVIDEKILQDTKYYYELNHWKSKQAAATDKERHSYAYFPLIEVGAWEVAGTSTRMIFGTGLGMAWTRGLTATLSDVLRLDIATLVYLPPSIPIDTTDLHAMLGCDEVNDFASSSPTSPKSSVIHAPSWMGYLKLQYSDKTFGDRQLPLSVCYETNRPLHDDSGETLEDPRETARLQKFSSRKKQSSKESWLSPPHPHQTCHLLILTSATLVDSRNAQQEWIQKLQTFYQGLLPQSATMPILRQTLTHPRDLLPCEASRIVLEGYMPLWDSYIQLGYISNFLDYPSRACRIKNTTDQFCHVLQGTLCCLPTTMVWMAQHRLQGAGITLPASLLKHFKTAHFLPFLYRLEHNKHGKLRIDKIKKPKRLQGTEDESSPEQQVHLELPLKGKAKEDEKRSWSLASRFDGSSEDENASFPKLTKQEIQLEALSTPFQFLPFYK